MALTVNYDIFLHEAGHAMIAYLADSIFEIEYVTAEHNFSKLIDERSVGGLRVRGKKPIDSLALWERDILALISLAGLAVDDINHANGNLTLDLYNDTIFFQKLHSYKYTCDSQLLSLHIFYLAPHLIVSERDYLGTCQEFLYKFFTTHWKILIDLRNELMKAPNLTLKGSQINSFLDNSALKK